MKSAPDNLLGAEECGDFAGDFDIRLILSLLLSRTGPGDVSTCRLSVCCLKPDLKKSVSVPNNCNSYFSSVAAQTLSEDFFCFLNTTGKSHVAQ